MPPNLPVAKVTAPHAHNTNLHAQDGVFTLERQDLQGKLDAPVDRTPIDQLVERFLREHQEKFGALFYRLTLGLRHAFALLWLLRLEGVNTATIYPGYRGVVRAMELEDACE